MPTNTILIVDIGNSRIKISAVQGHESLILESMSGADHQIKETQALIQKFDIQGAIVSTTRGHVPEDLSNLLDSRLKNVIYLNHLTPIPLINQYETPQTLGMDRLAAAVGAASLAPGKDLMVVDMGTAMTIDFVGYKGEFLGGVISPGMSMRFKALHTMTGSLPLCDRSDNVALMDHKDHLYGRTTVSAIERGVIQGVVMEIEGYAKKSGCETIFFTGGDSFYFAERVKCAIFANYELVTIGLNQIFRYNAASKTE